MSKGVKVTPMGNGEIQERKHLSLSGGQKVELLLKVDCGVSGRRITEEYAPRTRWVLAHNARNIQSMTFLHFPQKF